MNQERFDWCITQADSEVQDLGKQSYSLFAKERRLQLYKLAGMGLLIEALELAEEFSDMEALVELMSELHKSLQNSSSGRQARYDSDELQEWKSRIDRYFQRFGSPWSTAFFSRRVATDEVGSLFRMPKYQHSISAFLRSAPEYSQLSWINDISGEADYGTASKTLLRLAVNREVNLWSQRIELSIGKISLLASIEQSSSPLSSESSTLLREFDDLSDVSYIQERLYQHVEPMLQGITDSNARHEITKYLFAFEIGQENSVFHEIFLRSLMKLSSGLALDAIELVDVLTLIKPDFLSGETNMSSNTYVLALRVLDLCRRTERDSSRLNHVEALIWRRCMISDNWRIISNTNHQGDDELEQKVRSTLLYKTLSQIIDEHRQKGWQGSTGLPTPTQLCSNTSSVHRPELDLTREKQARVVHAINWEVKVLKDHVEHDRLESWFSWILKTVASTKQDEPHSK
ncbi:hypothetical protein KEM56_006439 [Ascosphaera pollenicola]|nr:hypothetical protein KEM56_006439 [Ascosphaera pollenicola]